MYIDDLYCIVKQSHIYESDIYVTLQKFKLHIDDPPRRKHAVFEGASVLASLYSTRDDYWISKQKYQEEGSARLAAKMRTLKV